MSYRFDYETIGLSDTIYLVGTYLDMIRTIEDIYKDNQINSMIEGRLIEHIYIGKVFPWATFKPPIETFQYKNRK